MLQGHTRSLPGAAFLSLACMVAGAATVPGGFTETVVTGGLSNPTAMAFAPDGRLFICQQGGQLRVVKNGTLLGTPFLTVTTDATGERGLLGVAFDPAFGSNGFVYVYYTVPGSPPHNRLSRFTASGDVALSGSQTNLLELDNLSATNHNGGAIHFGPDGKLYIAVGENAVASNAQTLSNLLGKILRLNQDGTIPTDNPFYTTATGVNRSIWALGLRNPFTFDFDPGSGRMFINDVGQNTTEEINEGIAGSNYGWPTCEGACSNPGFRNPIHQYSHSVGCAITGGVFYNPDTPQFPDEYLGVYFFADYCGGFVRKLDPFSGNAVTGFATGLSSPVDLKVGPDGALYTLERGRSSVFKISYTAAPGIVVHPTSQTVQPGQNATFTVVASGAEPLAYQWQRDGVDISGANGPQYTVLSVTAADNGAAFRCRVTNAFGSVTSNAATLIVTGNAAPTAMITAPAAGALYAAGDTISYAGTGSDPEDGNLPPASLAWTVVFHHDTHTHPFLGPLDGAGGSFVIPRTGETSANVFYRIHLEVTDSGGLGHSTQVDIRPRTVTLMLASSPSGLQLTLDGQPVTAPHTFEAVVGMTRTLGVISPQTLRRKQYGFVSWSDGGAATHDITVPVGDTTYTATFRRNR
jgi:glucose/arabinose dehydrogenase